MNVQFTGFAWFVLLALLLGVVLGAVGWRSVRRGRVGGSVWWMLWIMTVAVLGAISIYLFGDWLSLKLHPRPPTMSWKPDRASRLSRRFRRGSGGLLRR